MSVRTTLRRRAKAVLVLCAPLVLVGATSVVGTSSSSAARPASARASAAGRGAKKTTHGQDYRHDVSPKLRHIPKIPARTHDKETENPRTPVAHQDRPDPVVEGSMVAPNMPAPLLNFDGIAFPGVNCSCAPPDTNGEVGLTQYVQTVNQGLQVFSKSTGASVYGPVDTATIWSGFGGVCETNGDGDPVLLYDQIADRWLVS